MPNSVIDALAQFLGTKFLHIRNKEEKKEFFIFTTWVLKLCADQKKQWEKELDRAERPTEQGKKALGGGMEK